MRDTENHNESDELQPQAPLPEGEKFFDPWEEEFRKSYRKDDMAFDF